MRLADPEYNLEQLSHEMQICIAADRIVIFLIPEPVSNSTQREGKYLHCVLVLSHQL